MNEELKRQIRRRIRHLQYTGDKETVDLLVRILEGSMTPKQKQKYEEHMDVLRKVDVFRATGSLETPDRHLISLGKAVEIYYADLQKRGPDHAFEKSLLPSLEDDELKDVDTAKDAIKQIRRRTGMNDEDISSTAWCIFS